MKSPILCCATILTPALGALNTVYADSATWSLNPISGDWNTAENWTPATVPNGPADTATFSATSKSRVLFTNAQIEVASVIFDPAASDYTIIVVSDNNLGALTISGSGILNNSGKLQKFVARGDESNIDFHGGATAGSLTQFLMRGGDGFDAIGGRTHFFDDSSADHSAFIINGAQVVNAFGAEVEFYDRATAGNATFSVQAAGSASRNRASLYFYETSSGGDAMITMEGGATEDAFGGFVDFSDHSTGGNATCVANGGSAAGASGGFIDFVGRATGGQATLIANGGSNGGDGGEINFIDSAQGPEARVEVFGNGSLAIGGIRPAFVKIGSLEGDGVVCLGSNHLTVGTTGLSTEFSGLIQDSGTLTKSGSGSLTLSGGSTYTGGTTVQSGVLLVANVSGSATGSGPVSVTTGRLGGSGIIAGAVTIGAGSGTGAFLAPAAGTNVQATLTILSALTFNADATYTYTFRATRNSTSTDMVIANGVTINSGAMIALSGHTRGALKQGMVLTLISNTSADPISGTFSNLPDGGIVTINGNNLQASYTGGDGNDLTLTVVP